MNFFTFLSIYLVLATAKVSCQSYSKSCFLNYMLKSDLLDKTFEIYNNKAGVDATCEAAVNSTVSRIRSSTNDVCISEFYRRKYVSESLVKQYLLPQFRSSQSEVQFDDRFKLFMKKALNISTVICNNKDVFKPDLKAMMKNGKLQKDSKTKEIGCLQHHIMVKNKPIDEECKQIVNAIKNEFYQTTENDMKRVFAAPNDNLIDLKCSADKAKKQQFFERVFFFVVLAATKNMNDKQIDVLIRSAEGVIAGSTRLIFECMV